MDINVKIAIYEALRNEILQRLSFQQQIINFTFILAGILFTIICFKENKKLNI